jgi:Family of unknown function (DUF6527)
MARLSAKLRSLSHGPGRFGIAFWCPGCDESHAVITKGDAPPVWAWNGDVDAPTLSPSICVTGGPSSGRTVCHSFVRDGAIQFLGDCTHKLAGRTVPLPDWPDDHDEANFYLDPPHET